MKIIENATIYHCSYCKEYYVSQHHAKRHEDGCKHNPKNHNKCYEGCRHLVRTQEPDGVWYSYCAAQNNKQLYSYRAVHLGHLTKYPDSFDGAEQMPKDCSLFEII